MSISLSSKTSLHSSDILSCIARSSPYPLSTKYAIKYLLLHPAIRTKSMLLSSYDLSSNLRASLVISLFLGLTNDIIEFIIPLPALLILASTIFFSKFLLSSFSAL